MNIQKRIKELEAQHKEVCEKLNGMNNEMQKLINLRIQIEGAYKELNSLISEENSKDANC